MNYCSKCLSVVLLALISSCSSAGGFGQLSSEAASSKSQGNANTTTRGLVPAAEVGQAGSEPSASSASASAGAGGSAQDGESVKSTAPVQVAGAFLTTSCGPAEASDKLPKVAGQDAYGCAVAADGNKYTGAVNLKSVSVNSAGKSAAEVAVIVAPTSSRWHGYFYLDASRQGLSTSYSVTGLVDGVAVIMAARAPDPSGCKTTSTLSSNVNSWGAAVWSRSAIQVLNTTVFASGDSLSWRGSKGLSVSPSAAQLKTCPYLWKIAFKNAAGAQVGTTQLLAAFGAAQQVPQGAATAWMVSQVTSGSFAAAFSCDLALSLVRTTCY